MNTFDVFDTLIARRFITSMPIFDTLAQEFDIPDFASRRVAADTGERSLSEIYAQLDLPHGVMAREVQLEHEHAVPIQDNIERVADGDLLISDMYLNACDILSLLRGAGLERQVSLHQSNAGKSSGEVWRQLAGQPPDLHLGDNRHSDVEMPRRFGIPAELCTNAAPTAFECFIRDNGLPGVGFLMREIRLRKRRSRLQVLFDVANQINLPLLLVIAEMLARRTPEPKAFLGRDCQLLQKLYAAYFDPCYYVPFSRKIAIHQPAEATAYLEAHAGPDAVFVDLSSTGATWQRLDFKRQILVVIYSDQHFYTSERPEPPPTFSFLARNSECGQTDSTLELFNCGDHGYIRGIECFGGRIYRGIYADPDLAEDVTREIHAPVRSACALAPSYRDIVRTELGRMSEGSLSELFRMLLINVNNQKRLVDLMPAVGESEKRYLADLAQP